jgi:very-short-patch-repair endonuclease
MMTDMIESCAMADRQREFARRMRAQPTDAEHVLWQRLRHDISLTGSHFRRQALVGPFIVDFASRKAKLVIELDGGQHDWQQASDALRTRQIEAAGYRILRFWNNDVLGNLEGVLGEIQRGLPHPPDPSPQGGGEPRQHAKRVPRRSRRERN